MPSRATPATDRRKIILVLSGGNALGAVQGGIYEAMQRAAILPRWVIGTSIGAINGAIIAGNAPEGRLARLREFWAAAAGPDFAFPPIGNTQMHRLRSLAGAGRSFLFGRPPLFTPRLPAFGAGQRAAWFDRTALIRLLRRLVDFERLNDGETRFTVNATDIATGEEVLFDTAQQRIGPHHLLASSALLPDFEPVEIDGRHYADGSLASNLTFEPLLRAPLPGDVFCIVADLFKPSGLPPRSLQEGIDMREDVVFTAQSRKMIETWRREHAMRRRNGKAAGVALLHFAYRCPGDDLAVRTYDFSSETIRLRWAAGLQGAAKIMKSSDAVPRIADGFEVQAIHIGAPAHEAAASSSA